MTKNSRRVSVARRFAFLAVLILIGLAVSIRHFGGQKTAPSHQAPSHQAVAPAQAAQLLDRLPLSFEPNRGQADRNVQYVAHGPGYTVSLGGNQASVRMKDGAVVSMRFTSNSPKTSGLVDRQSSVTNYYMDLRDRSKWLERVPNYSSVRYQEVYPGIDAIFRGNGNRLRYDYVVKPGADPRSIQMTMSGAQRLRLTANGDLQLQDGLVQQKPYIYQEFHGKQKQISGSYVLLADNRVGFQVGKYDRRRELIIDPTFLVGGYLGGTGIDSVRGIQQDLNNLYLVGDTNSVVFPAPCVATTFCDGTKPAGSGTAAFFVSLTRNGQTLNHRTFFGNDTTNTYGGVSVARGIALGYDLGATTALAFVVGDSNTHVTATVTDNGATTPTGAFSVGTSPESIGQTEAFMLTFNLGTGVLIPAASAWIGDNLASSTTVTHGNAIVSNCPTVTGATVQCNGVAALTVWIGGDTNSAALTGLSPSSMQPLEQGGQDGFVTQLQLVTGPTLAAATVPCAVPAVAPCALSTYVGGSQTDTVTALTTANAPSALPNPPGTATDLIVAGNTNSDATQGFPTTAGTFAHSIPGFPSGTTQGFVLRLPNTLVMAPVFGTYVGFANGTNQIFGIALDPYLGLPAGPGNPGIYITGDTTSAGEATVGALQGTIGGGKDAYLTRLNVTGTALDFYTYLGGSNDDTGLAVAVDPLGEAWVVGQTASPNFPILDSNAGDTATPKNELLGSALTAPAQQAGFIAKIGLLPQPLGQGVGVPPLGYPPVGATPQPPVTGTHLYYSELDGAGNSLGVSPNGLTPADPAAGIGADNAGSAINAIVLDLITPVPNTANVFFGGWTDGTAVTSPNAFQAALAGSRDGFLGGLQFNELYFSTNPLTFTVIDGAPSAAQNTTLTFTNATVALTFGAVNYMCGPGNPEGFVVRNCTTAWLNPPAFVAGTGVLTLSLNVAANTLPPGNYQATFTISGNFDNSPQTVVVNLIVSNAFQAVGSVSRGFQKDEFAAVIEGLGPNNVVGTNNGADTDSFTIVPTSAFTSPLQYTASIQYSTANAPGCTTATSWVTIAPATPTTAAAGNLGGGVPLAVTYNSGILQSMDLHTVETPWTNPKCTAQITVSAPDNANVPNLVFTITMNFDSELIPANVTVPAPAMTEAVTPAANNLGVPTRNETTSPVVFNFPSPFAAATSQTISLQGDSLPDSFGVPLIGNATFGASCTVGVTASPTNVAALLAPNQEYIAPDYQNIALLGEGANGGLPANGNVLGVAPPNPFLSFAITVNPVNCPNNVVLTGATVTLSPATPTAIACQAQSTLGGGASIPCANTEFASLVIPVTVNIGNVLQSVSSNGRPHGFFTGPITGGSITDTPNGYEQVGYSIAPNNGIGGDQTAPTTAGTAVIENNALWNYNVILSTTSPLPPNQGGAPAFPFSLNVWTTASGGAGCTFTPATSAAHPVVVVAPGAATADWFTATPSQATIFGGAGGSATVSFSVNQAIWATLPATATGCTYEGWVFATATGIPGSPTVSYAVSFVKIIQPVTDVLTAPTNIVLAPSAVTTPTTSPLGANAITFMGTVGQGLLPSQTLVKQYPGNGPANPPPGLQDLIGGDAGFTADVETNPVAGTNYTTGTPYPGMNTDSAAFVPDAAQTSWLTVTGPQTASLNVFNVAQSLQGSLGAYACGLGNAFWCDNLLLTANTTNLTASPSMVAPSPGVGPANGCPAGTLPAGAVGAANVPAALQSNLLTQDICVTPYTGTLRQRSGGSGNDNPRNNGSISGQNVEEIPVQFVLLPATGQTTILAAGQASTNVVIPAFTIGANPAAAACAPGVLITGTSTQGVANGLVVTPTQTSGPAGLVSVPIVLTGGTTPTTMTICPGQAFLASATQGVYAAAVTVNSPNAIPATLNISLTVNAQIEANGQINYTAPNFANFTSGSNAATFAANNCLATIPITAATNGAGVPITATVVSGPVTAALSGAGTTPTNLGLCPSAPALAALAPGTYPISVTLSNGANTLNATVTSSITVQGIVNVAGPTGFAYTWSGSAPAAQQIPVSSSPTPISGLTLTTAGNCSWGTFSLAGTSTPTMINASVKSPSMPPGGYVCTLTVSGAAVNGAATIAGQNTVTLTVNPLPFFATEVAVGGGFYSMTLPNGSLFGTYTYLSNNVIWHEDLGYEYITPANDGKNGIFMYDFNSGHWWYTSPTFYFPYLYDFTLGSVIYYFPSQTNPGHYTSSPEDFYIFSTGKVVTDPPL